MKRYLMALIVVLSVVCSYADVSVTYYVSANRGDDASAVINDRTKSFKTLDAAIAKALTYTASERRDHRFIIEKGTYDLARFHIQCNRFIMIGVDNILDPTLDLIVDPVRYPDWNSTPVVIHQGTPVAPKDTAYLSIFLDYSYQTVKMIGIRFENFTLPDRGMLIRFHNTIDTLALYRVEFDSITCGIPNIQNGSKLLEFLSPGQGFVMKNSSFRNITINGVADQEFKIMNVTAQSIHTRFSNCTFENIQGTNTRTMFTYFYSGQLKLDSCRIHNNKMYQFSNTNSNGLYTTLTNTVVSKNDFSSTAFGTCNMQIEQSVFYRNTVFNLNTQNFNSYNSIIILDSIQQYKQDTPGNQSYYTHCLFNMLDTVGKLPNSYIGTRIDNSEHFISPETGDFHLVPWSQGIKMGTAGQNVGLYTNTPSARTAATISFASDTLVRNLLLNEPRKDTITFTNNGTGPLDLSAPFNLDSITVTGSNNGSFTSMALLPASGTIAAGGTGKLIIEYSGATTSDTLSIRFGLAALNHGKTFTYVRNVNSSIMWNRAILINDHKPGSPMIDCGSIKKLEIKTVPVTFKNQASQPVTLDSIVLTDQTNFEFVDYVTNIVIPANGQVVKNIEFHPTVTGTYTSKMKLYSKIYSGVDSAQQIRGVASDASLVLDKQYIQFKDIKIGEKDTAVVTISDTADLALMISLMNTTSKDIAVKERGNSAALTYPISVDKVTPRTFEIIWSPATAGALKDTLVIYSTGAVSTKLITLTGNAIAPNFSATQIFYDLGNVPVKSTQSIALKLLNNGSAQITVDSIKSFDPSVSIIPLANKIISSKDSATASVKVAITSAQGGVLDSARIQVYYNDHTVNGKNSFPVYISAKFVANPVISFASISSKKLNWSETPITITAAAHDSDIVGGAPGIKKYIWSPATITDTTASVVVKASALALGANVIKVYAIDNEGDMSLAATDTITVDGNLPFAKIDSIVPGSVIIRDGANIKLNLTAYDMDQNATSAKDGLKSVQWYSTVAGVLTGVKSKIATFDPSSLELGLHGFYAMVTDSEGQISYSDTMFIPVQNSMGHALIVTGAVFGDNSYFMNNISPNANIAYKRLRDRGFSDAQIRYMNPVSWQSIDGDGLTDSKIVDTTKITKAAVHAYLQSIAADMKKDIPLVIYFLGHGNASKQNAKFYLNDSEYVDPATLNTWLTEFGDLSANKSYITVILDFCYSGGFQTGLKSATQKRAIITSASTGSTAYFARGKSFGTTIFNEMYRGKSLKSCFETAKLWSDQNAPGGAKATPTINANGNATNSETSDLTLADGIYIGGSQQLQGLIAEIDSVKTSVKSSSVDLTVSVLGDVNTVRCRVVPADFDPSKGTYGTLPTTDLTFDSKTKQFNGTVSGLKNGKYLFMVEGEDAGSNAILPQGVAVEIGGTGILVTSAPKQLFFGTALIGGSTVLKFGLPETAPVAINIYDLRGRLVNQLVNGVLNAGFYSIPLDNLNAAGCYITRFAAGSKMFTEKVMIQR